MLRSGEATHLRGSSWLGQNTPIGTDVKPRATGRLNGLHRRFAVQLVASMLLVSVPLMIVLAVLLTRGASASLTSAAEDKGGDVARGVTLRLEDWQTERRSDMQIVAAARGGRPQGPANRSAARSGSTRPTTATHGWMSWMSAANCGVQQERYPRGPQPDRTGSGAPFAGKPVLTSLARQGDHIEWIIAQPVMGAAATGRASSSVSSSTVVLPILLEPRTGRRERVVVVDAQHLLLYDSVTMSKAADDAAFLAAGALSEAVDNAATDLPPGPASRVRPTSPMQTAATWSGGFDPVDDLNWIDHHPGQARSRCSRR